MKTIKTITLLTGLSITLSACNLENFLVTIEYTDTEEQQEIVSNTVVGDDREVESSSDQETGSDENQEHSPLLGTVSYTFPGPIDSVGQNEVTAVLQIQELLTETPLATLDEISHQQFADLGDSNGVFSPISYPTISRFLNIAAGRTLASFDTLGADWGNPTSTGLPLTYTNRIWAQKAYLFAETFQASMISDLSTQWQETDFLLGARPDVLDIAMSWKTRVVFQNEIGLHAQWDVPVSEIREFDGLWQDGSSYQERVPMIGWLGNYPRYDQDGFKAVKLPLKDDQFQMIVVMPDAASWSETQSNIVQILGDFDSLATEQETHFTLPVFTTSTDYQITPWIDATENFAGVNGEGHLKLNSLRNTSVMGVGASGVSASTTTTVTLEGDDSETAAQFYGYYQDTYAAVSAIYDLYIWDASGGGGVSIYPTNICSLVKENLSSNQALPFIFVVQEKQTGAIVNLGRIKSLEGEEVYREVCSGEKRQYQDNIWGAAGDVDHTNTSDYLFVTQDENTANTDETPDVFKQYALAVLASTEGNSLISPYLDLQSKLLINAALPDEDRAAFLSDLSLTDVTPDLFNSIRPLDGIGSARVLVQSDYELKNEYLELIANSWQSAPLVRDFRESPTQAQDETAEWLLTHSHQEMATPGSIGMRTRVLYNAAFSSSINLTGTLTTGSFANADSIVFNVPMVAFEGVFPAYAAENYDAVEIATKEASLDVLFVTPHQGKFAEIKANLAQVLADIESGKTEQAISRKFPQFSAELNMRVPAAESTDLKFTNASGVRGLYSGASSQKAQFSLGQDGVAVGSHAWATLNAAPDFSYFGYLSFDNIVSDAQILYSCSVDMPSSAADTAPFFYFLRDRSSGVILLAGQYLRVQGGDQSSCFEPQPGAFDPIISPVPSGD
ncbi:MAG: hypothetical protein OEZ43_04475 [Gammaproteobacteria bacterium]|nr:hypothetical protein [Gammaproteobacteria bacterium]